jgi:hypothetical protein
MEVCDMKLLNSILSTVSFVIGVIAYAIQDDPATGAYFTAVAACLRISEQED